MKIRQINSSSDLSRLGVENQKNALRQIRERECYPYVNRGTLWYSRLTEEQKTEFNNWYQAWLDVTETLTIPTKPSWL